MWIPYPEKVRCYGGIGLRRLPALLDLGQQVRHDAPEGPEVLRSPLHSLHMHAILHTHLACSPVLMVPWSRLWPHYLANNTAGGTYRQEVHILSKWVDEAFDALISSCTGIDRHGCAGERA